MTGYWVKAPISESSAFLRIEDCFITGNPIEQKGHFQVLGDTAYVRNVTIFPGHLTFWGAIKWGLLGLLRLGPNRVNRIKKWIPFGGRDE